MGRSTETPDDQMSDNIRRQLATLANQFGLSKNGMLEPATTRLLCHALLERLPEDGLVEAVESLLRMYEFYPQPPQAPTPPTATSIPTRITGSYVEPVYPVTEE